MRKTKQGVSLIVLIITIVVMIILASAIMIQLGKTNIFKKASDAVNAANLKEVQTLAALAWSDAYLKYKNENITIEEKDAKIEEAVNAALVKAGINLNDYNIKITAKGVTVKVTSLSEITTDGVPIPKGFVKSPYPNEGTKDGGLVIYALTPAEIKAGKTTITDSHQTALETRNQFVWVPVDPNEFETKFKANCKVVTLGEAGYWELMLGEDNMPLDNTINTSNYISPTTLKEATEMYASVKRYGGFYIARYEVGTKNLMQDAKGFRAERVIIKDGSNSKLSITMGKYPYNFVAWGPSMDNETSDDGAVSLARAFYPSSDSRYGVVSTLTYGVQWDRTVAWWKEMNESVNIANGVYETTTIESNEVNSGAKYSEFDGKKFSEWNTLTTKKESGKWLITTGGYKNANIYNIYDMAGNLYEWTMQGHSGNTRVRRGGYYGNAVHAGTYSTSGVPGGSEYMGFRPALYIK